MENITKIYMDVCCLNRPFDDQSDIKIHLESEIILAILYLCENGKFDLLNSEIIEFEVNNNPDKDKTKQINLILSLSQYKILLSEEIIMRASYFETFGINAFDAFHLACAEYSADIFLTVDERFLKKASGIRDLKVNISNPIDWLKEVK